MSRRSASSVANPSIADSSSTLYVGGFCASYTGGGGDDGGDGCDGGGGGDIISSSDEASSWYLSRPFFSRDGFLITSDGRTSGVIRSLSLVSPSGRDPQEVTFHVHKA